MRHFFTSAEMSWVRCVRTPYVHFRPMTLTGQLAIKPTRGRSSRRQRIFKNHGITISLLVY